MDLIAQFMSMMTLVFAIASIIAGIFTAYFGSGKSRAVGGILIIIGLVVFVLFMWGATWLNDYIGMPDASSIFYFKDLILQGVVAIVGALIGALVALGIFLLAIMKA